MKRKVIWARLRVECNFGSKYFCDIDKALAYYDGKVAERKDGRRQGPPLPAALRRRAV